MSNLQIPLLDKDEMLTDKIDKNEIDKNNKNEIDKNNKNEIDKNKKGNIFVIHEHHATHLHWDLRLEIGDVLASWAVPKDPREINEGVKRLAIQVEDHPIDYASFEGKIPEGMYGAGDVKIWDSGELILEEKKENKLTFELKGKVMNGKYSLVKTRYSEKSWLFFMRK